MHRKLRLEDVSVDGREVLTRVDFNVPLTQDLEVADDIRIRRSVPSIRHIIEAGGKPVLMSHLGRPKGEVRDELRLAPAAQRLRELIGSHVEMAPDCVGDATEELVAAMKQGDIVLLENLRFHREETQNEPDFARRLARLGDVYVNDAFGTAHRAHASTVGVTEYIDARAMGFLMQQELTNLAKATDCPARPYLAILGGAKVSDKIGMIENLMTKVDTFLIGGGMAFTFLKAQGGEIGDSLVEEDKIGEAGRLLEASVVRGVRLLLPTDVVVADSAVAEARSRTVSSHGIDPGWRGVDIGPETVRAFAREISSAKTIVWNGPLGISELAPFAAGTVGVAGAVADRTAQGAVSIVGGGDTAAAVARAGVADKMTHISTGGGASLMFLEGRPLPGVEALSDAS